MKKETKDHDAAKRAIGTAMYDARKSARLTQTQLASLIGVSHAAISFWENGVNIPNILDCWRIADVLSVPLDDLVGRG
jgi:transcriptional regulator with XRE-family HTH domain